MTKRLNQQLFQPLLPQADVTDVVPATEGESASAAQPDVNAQITAAVAAENSRIMGILNCEEAHGREEQARVLDKLRYDLKRPAAFWPQHHRVHRRAVTLRWIV